MKEKYILFIVNDCFFCDQAREILKKKECVLINVNNDLMIRSQVKEAFDWNTFPIILQKEETKLKLIGGYVDLKEQVGLDGNEK